MTPVDAPAGPLLQHTLFLEGALSLVGDAVIAVDLSGHVAYANPGALSLIGTTAQAMNGAMLSNSLSVIDVVTGETIGGALEQAMNDRLSPPITHKAVLLNGADVPIIIEYTISIIEGAGAPIGAVIVLRDIMQRRQTEQALQSSEAALIANTAALFQEKERAQVTLNSIADSVVSTDFRGRITFLNNIAETMTGWSQAQAIGRQLDEVFCLSDAETRKRIACPAMRAIIEDRAVETADQTVLISRTGKEIPIANRAAPIHDRDGGVVGAVIVAHDVSEARETTKRLTRLALLDTLTGLPNRIVLVDRLNQAIEMAQRHEKKLAVLFIDLNKFKPVNDLLGHACGDELLRQVAGRLTHCVRASDTVCRLGGDEYVILLSEIAHDGDAELCAEKVRSAVNRRFLVQGHSIQIGASVGVAIWPHHAKDADSLLIAADKAMYDAKTESRLTSQPAY